MNKNLAQQKLAASLRAQAEALLATADAVEAIATSEVDLDFVTLSTAAAELGIRQRVIRDAGRRGELVLGKAGARVVVARAELARWIASRAPVVKPKTDTTQSDDVADLIPLARAAERMRRRAAR